MSSVFLVLQFVLTVVLTVAILLQKSTSIGLGAYSGSNESLFGAKGPAGFLAKFTFIVGILFVANTLALGYTYNQSLRNSVVETKEFKEIVPNAIPEKTAPAAPVSEPTKEATPMVSDTNASVMPMSEANATIAPASETNATNAENNASN